MKTLPFCTIAALVLTYGPLHAADDPPALALPVAEHHWLEQLVGQWDAEIEMQFAPDQPAATFDAVESVKPLGGFWVISESKSDIEGAAFEGRMTLGYDPEKQKYIGTWVDSMTSILWVYEGTVDEAGKVLTLKTQGPCLHEGGRIAKFEEVIEIVGPDEKTFTSRMQNADGEWQTLMVIRYQRKT